MSAFWFLWVIEGESAKRVNEVCVKRKIAPCPPFRENPNRPLCRPHRYRRAEIWRLATFITIFGINVFRIHRRIPKWAENH